jgi:hypothetical protein
MGGKSSVTLFLTEFAATGADPAWLEHPAYRPAHDWSIELYGEPEAPPVEPAEPDICDDCCIDRPRERLGRISVYAECVARRVAVALKLASEGAGAGSERTEG